MTRAVLSAALLAAASVTAASPVEWGDRAAGYRLVLLRFPGEVASRFALAAAEAHEGQVLDAWHQIQILGRQVPAADRPAVLRQMTADARAILRRNPQDLHARYRLGLALYLAGDLRGALAEATAAREAEPSNPWSIGYQGYLQSELGDLDGAIATWQEGLRRDPDNGLLHYALSVAYARRGDLRRAGYHLVRAYRNRDLFAPEGGR